MRICTQRIEIHKEEIVVVFRVDPDPGFDTSEGLSDTNVGKSFMQDRTRRSIAALSPGSCKTRRISAYCFPYGY